MILQSLVQYYEELLRKGKVGAPGWSTEKVNYAITIDLEGNLKNIVSLEKEVQRGKKTVFIPKECNVPQKAKRARGIMANFLCDNAKYLLGIWNKTGNIETDKKEKEDAEKCFQATKELHQLILKDATDAISKSILLFFDKWSFDIESIQLGVSIEALLKASNLVFRSYEDGIEILEYDSIQKIWNEFTHRNAENENRKGRCLVTGELAPIARLHPSIKGVAGAQSSGASLVSYNATAFESYGKEQGDNAPVSEYAANAYGNALNYLLSQQNHRRLMGDTTIAFWEDSAEDAYSDIMDMLLGDVEESMQDKLLHVVDAIVKGKKCKFEETELNPMTGFCILGLAPNAARLSVRFFQRDSFGNFIKNINDHIERLEIIKPSMEYKKYPTVGRILYETVNQNSKDKTVQPALVGAFLRAVLNNTLYPSVVYTHMMLRIRADKKVNWVRAAMIKAYLLQNSTTQKEVVKFMELNESSENISYTLGRCFAVLEQIQDEAYGDVNASIKDRFFNAASATPSYVFPRLLKLANNHLHVLERKKIGMKINLEKQLTELLGKIHEEFPNRLSLEEQGTFILGYYHQTQKRYEKKKENEETIDIQ